MAENAKILVIEQHGSRKRKTAIHHALNKRLIFDILRQQQKNAREQCSCDLKSCYDRIVHCFASLAMRRAVVAESAPVSMFSTIKKLNNTVMTAFGDSELSFGGEEWRDLEVISMGVGQGNRAGPAIWVVTSSVLFDVLRGNGYGAINHELHIAGFGFIDDTNILQTGLESDNYWEMSEKLQTAINLWERAR